MPTQESQLIGCGGLDLDLDRDAQRDLLAQALDSWGGPPARILVLAPDITRLHSGAGLLTALLFELAGNRSHIDVLPTIGTHLPMTPDEIAHMYPGVPANRFLVHDWRHGTVQLGEVPSDFVADLTDGRLDYSVAVEVNRVLLEGGYDLIVSIGQVVPHEVVGMANGNKNIFVGAGGIDMLNKSHFMGAVHGMERMMGRIDTPVRRTFDYAEASFLAGMPIQYIQTVVAGDGRGGLAMRGLFAGPGRRPFLEAAQLSRQANLELLPSPLRKVVVWLDPHKFRSTWLGNKAIYRTRMAMADEGELIVLAPGLKEFGEDATIDKLIRKYGYRGTPHTLRMVEENADLRDNLSAAAHLIHGSSENRFSITYAPGPGVSREEIEAVGFRPGDLDALMKRYPADRLKDGLNTIDGEDIFYISNPGLGLWALELDFADPA